MSRPPRVPPIYKQDDKIFPPGPRFPPPPKTPDQEYEEKQIFVNPSIDKKYASFYTYSDHIPSFQYPEIQIIKDEDLGNYEEIRKNISFGTDIIGIILNPKLLKSNNIFQDPEILKYRMFSSYKNMYNYITKNTIKEIKDIDYDEDIDEEDYYKGEILKMFINDSKEIKTKKLLEISNSYDDNLCSIISCDDGISCIPIYTINNLLDYYGKKVDVSNQENEINFKRKKSLALYNSSHNLNCTINGIYNKKCLDDEKSFYKYLYDLLKNNINQNFNSKKISSTIQKNKEKLDNLILYYKPFCLPDIWYNPTIIEINHCMRQYERLINNSLETIYNQEKLFYYHGCYELKDDDYGKPEFMADFEQINSWGNQFIGYIFVYPFARDPNSSGFLYQYTTLYIDTEPKGKDNKKYKDGKKHYNIYCFEPSKYPIRDSIIKFIYYLCIYNKIQPKEINIISNNKPLHDKFVFLNNAIYAIIALIALAYGIDFYKFCNLPIYGNFLHQIKQIMFINKKKYL